MTRILVVDDEMAIASIIAAVLGEFGHEVETASNGLEALEQLQRGTFDLIVLDLRMPIMDGPTFLEASRRLIPQVPIIIVSAELNPTALFPSDHRIASVLNKPFAMLSLKKAIDTVIVGTEEPALGWA